MRYLVDVRVDGDKKRTYRIDASDETQVIERLKLRLPPAQRDTVLVDGIKIDPATVGGDDPFGVYGGE